MAGDPTADVVFGFIESKLEEAVRSQAQDQGILDGLEVLPDSPGPVASWALQYRASNCHVHAADAAQVGYVDDLAYPLVDTDPVRLVERARKLATILFQVFWFFALELNASVGKTQLLLKLRGRGSRAIAQD
eukprot:13402404-Alexandrium_andersonii.AAC.1